MVFSFAFNLLYWALFVKQVPPSPTPSDPDSYEDIDSQGQEKEGQENEQEEKEGEEKNLKISWMAMGLFSAHPRCIHQIMLGQIAFIIVYTSTS